MLGERNWRDIINKAIEEKYLEKIEKIEDEDKIDVNECVRCLRRSYYDRNQPLNLSKREKIRTILTNGIKSINKEYNIEGLVIVGHANIIVDGILFNILLRKELPSEPLPQDILALNANLSIFNIESGVLLYVDGGGNSVEFSLVRDNRLFNEVLRRAKVLATLLKEKKVPIIEPSNECIECQYQERCYTRKLRHGESFIEKILGKNREE